MMFKATWIIVAALFIGKSAGIAIPVKLDPTSYGQHKSAGTPNPKDWATKSGSHSSSQSGTVQDASSKPIPGETEEDEYQKGKYGSYQQPNKKDSSGNSADAEGETESGSSDEHSAWYPSQNGTISSSAEKQPGQSFDEDRPWINTNSSGSSVHSYPPVQNSSDCLIAGDGSQAPNPGSPNNGILSGWNETAASPTSHSGEEFEHPDKKPSGLDSGDEDEDEGEDDDDEDEDGSEDSHEHDRSSAVGLEPPVDGQAQSPSSQGPFSHKKGEKPYKFQPKPIYYPADSPSGYYNSKGKPTYPGSGY